MATSIPPEVDDIGKQGYHHGDLRRVIMNAAVEAIDASGTGGWSMRELARRAGVSHAAPAHHFGDKEGLFTALATEGYTRFAEVLAAAGDDLLELGVAYVDFAADHRALFEVMFRPELFDETDQCLAAARQAAWRALNEGARGLTETAGASASVAAWSIAHGFAELWNSGTLTPPPDTTAGESARPVLKVLLR
ncbi:TetR/AcrR family transcriptional regulator [Actinocorallia sp. API 0066]|uniref:TetR/AcrR family transcriptional regulator n=1 Tax=Actinocorallia sp. API 0066 TaxID=2896846 RepID=UPI001E291742|nr:TetR/AcrR family transcriptional regulator [Actinocorallia sp. API 0066]MCD0451582.1 TetR/AcrR family transcriptional regulator [Actinocorallia sp. API 0066]